MKNVASRNGVNTSRRQDVYSRLDEETLTQGDKRKKSGAWQGVSSQTSEGRKQEDKKRRGTDAGRVGTPRLLFSLHPLERIDARGVDGGAACASCVDNLLISRRTKMAHGASIDGLVTRARWNPDSFYFPAHVLLHQTSRCTGLVPLARPRILTIVCWLNEICNSVSRNLVFNKLGIQQLTLCSQINFHKKINLKHIIILILYHSPNIIDYL